MLNAILSYLHGLIGIVCVLANIVSVDSCRALAAASESEPPTIDRCEMKWVYNPLALLNDGPIQAELRVSEEQKESIAALSSEFFTALSPVHDKHRQVNGLVGHERDQQLQAIQQEYAVVADRFGKKAVDLLDAKQKSRLMQITVQLQSVAVFYNPQVMNTLQLNERQRVEIVALRGRLNEDINKLASRCRQEKQDRHHYEKELDRLLAEAKEKAIKLLDAQQREVFNGIQGGPLSFSRRDLRLEIPCPQR